MIIGVVDAVVLYKCSSHGTQQRGLGSFALETLVGLWTDDSPEAFLNRAKFLKIYFRVLIQVLFTLLSSYGHTYLLSAWQ